MYTAVPCGCPTVITVDNNNNNYYYYNYNNNYNTLYMAVP